MVAPQRLFLAAISLAVALASCPRAVEAHGFAPISQNAMARSHRSVMEARHAQAVDYAKRAVDLPGAQRFAKRKATAAQRAAQEKLNQQAAEFHSQNSEWQTAAMESLKKGEMPKSFDEYWGGATQSAQASSTPAASSSSSSAQDSDNSGEDQDGNEGSDNDGDNTSEESSDAAAPKPVQAAAKKPSSSGSSAHHQQQKPKQQQQQQQQQQAETKPKKSGSSNPIKDVADTVTGLLTGEGTYYAPGLGACGKTNVVSDRIVAISAELFDSFGTGNPNNNPVCGHQVKATYNGKTTTATVVDRCVGCARGDLDFTETGFQDLADLSVGRLRGLKWSWVGAAPGK